MKRRIALLLVLISISNATFAIVLGGSNFGISGYPDHSCMKPDKPIKPYRFNSRWEIDSYNSQVDSYNADRQRYVDCVKDYLENASNDIKRIEEKMGEAIEEAKRPSF
jgi:hypothetical protein